MTMELIQHIELGSAQANIDFNSIGTSWTDLVVVFSLRSSLSGEYANVGFRFNGDTGNNYSVRLLYGLGSGSGASAAITSNMLQYHYATASSATSSTFSNGQLYIPNYQSSSAKSTSGDSVGENNATATIQALTAGLWTGTSAISSISIVPQSGGNFVAGSSATLYGIKRYNTTLSPKATGGAISYDSVNNKWVHAFYTSGTFTPTENISGVEYFLVGGGGGGGGFQSGVDWGGGGSGGFITSGSFSAVSATNYTVTIGGGGSGAGNNTNGGAGSSTVFGSFTANGGAGGTFGNPNGGFGEGNLNSPISTRFGGIGETYLGINYAGGGSNGNAEPPAPSDHGVNYGGGWSWQSNNGPFQSALANRGGGGNGSWQGGAVGGNGGSGIVIVRYS